MSEQLHTSLYSEEARQRMERIVDKLFPILEHGDLRTLFEHPIVDDEVCRIQAPGDGEVITRFSGFDVGSEGTGARA